MTSVPDDRLRLETLLQYFFDETLSDEEAEEVLALFDRFPTWKVEARQNFETERLFRFGNDLQKILPARLLDKLAASARQTPRPLEKSGPAENLGLWLIDMDELTRLAAESPSLPRPEPKPARKPTATVPKPAKPYKPLLPLRLLVPLLLLAFGLAVYFEFRPAAETSEPDDPFGPFPARITELIDATFDENAVPLKKDRRLAVGPVALRSGLMQIEYKNGVRVVLEGPAKYHVETPLEAACDLGRLSVFVPPEGKGFAVMTPKMTVRDLGTAFFLDVDAEKTELHVIEGEVEANWLTKDWLPFKAGRGVERREGKEVRNFVAEPGVFVSETSVRTRKADYVDRRRTVWQRQRETVFAEPSLVYRLDPETVSRLAKVSGSREDKTALRFHGPKDRVEASVRGSYRDLTLLASLRLDQLNVQPSMIAMGNGFYSTPGEFHWQVDRFGALHFYINYGKLDTRAFSTAVVLRSENCRTWISLALVVDASRKTITHYLDGRKVAEFPWTPIDLSIDRLVIGSDPDGVRKRTRAFFKGEIEDLFIFSRAFDTKEIEEFYQNSR